MLFINLLVQDYYAFCDNDSLIIKDGKKGTVLPKLKKYGLKILLKKQDKS
jgi:hypothetical protein